MITTELTRMFALQSRSSWARWAAWRADAWSPLCPMPAASDSQAAATATLVRLLTDKPWGVGLIT